MTEHEFHTLSRAALHEELQMLGRPMEPAEVDALAGMGVLPVVSVDDEGYPAFAILQLVDAVAIRGAGQVDDLRRRAAVFRGASAGDADALSKAHRELREALAERSVLGELHRLLPVLESVALETLRGDARLEWRIRQSLVELARVMASDKYRDDAMTPVFGPGDRERQPRGATAPRPAARLLPPVAEPAPQRRVTSYSGLPPAVPTEPPVRESGPSTDRLPRIAVAEPYRLGPEDRHPPGFRSDAGVRMPVLRERKDSQTTSAPQEVERTDAFPVADSDAAPVLVDDARAFVEASQAAQAVADAAAADAANSIETRPRSADRTSGSRTSRSGERHFRPATPQASETARSRDSHDAEHDLDHDSSPPQTEENAGVAGATPSGPPRAEFESVQRTRELGAVPPRTSLDHARRAALRRGAASLSASRSASRPTTEAELLEMRGDMPLWNLPEPRVDAAGEPVSPAADMVAVPDDPGTAVVAGLALADAHRREGKQTSEEVTLQALLASLPPGHERLAVVRRLAAVYITRPGGAEASIDLYRETLRSGVFDEKIVHALTSLLRGAGRTDDVFDMLRIAAEFSEPPEKTHYMRAASRAANELIADDEQALDVLERGVEATSGDPEVLTELARRFRRMGDDLSELTALEQVVETEGPARVPDVTVRVAELQLGRPRGAARAAELMGALLEAEDVLPVVESRLATLVPEVAERAGDDRLSLRWHRRAATRTTAPAELVHHLRRVLVAEERLEVDPQERVWTADTALEAAEAAGLAAPERADILLAAARARRSVGHWNSAIEHATRAADPWLANEPDHAVCTDAVALVADVAPTAIDERPALEFLSRAAATGVAAHRACYARTLARMDRWDDAVAVLQGLVADSDEGTEAREAFSAQLERARLRLELH